MGSDDDWFAGYEPERPEAAPVRSPEKPAPKGWTPGLRRVAVLALCCESCGSLQMTKQNAYKSIIYWRCESCNGQQKEPLELKPKRATVLPG